ncbi:hypothetical protein L1987_88074 [Smallanthus sonchifolius]|nr:hypothetical protein L1987_88074 [Smallanthus sonchifolius]
MISTCRCVFGYSSTATRRHSRQQEHEVLRVFLEEHALPGSTRTSGFFVNSYLVDSCKLWAKISLLDSCKACA